MTDSLAIACHTKTHNTFKSRPFILQQKTG